MIIENRKGLDTWISHKGTSEKSRIFCDKIEYIHDRKGRIFDHHLMFWNNNKLVFKVWLKSDKEFKNIKEALKSVGILCK